MQPKSDLSDDCLNKYDRSRSSSGGGGRKGLSLQTQPHNVQLVNQPTGIPQLYLNHQTELTTALKNH